MSELYAAVYRDRCQAEHVARVHGGTVVRCIDMTSGLGVWRIQRDEPR